MAWRSLESPLVIACELWVCAFVPCLVGIHCIISSAFFFLLVNGLHEIMHAKDVEAEAMGSP